MTRTILLTGFEPFGGQTVNASWEAVRRVEAAWSGPGRLVTVQLPVSFRGARQALRLAVRDHEPDVVVCVGEAGGRAAVGIERAALNVIDAPIPDNDGSAPVDVPVVAGAPAAFFSGLPLRACLAAGRATGVPVEVSNTAGTYVCNATFYALMHLLASRPDVLGGFVHVPRTPAQVAPGAPSLSTEATAPALAAVLHAALAPEAIAEVAAGRLS
ncbi:pyroglutamyl-peptidase I [Actinotalea ferrariae]|uniref:pyroglutamyl-peptidase I n=1 Tax=Actinotalea ferrariae TaxID=1386098 RepID=UPI001C8C4464|nr:pyroglutamyl-peptidase I [Actinotalea ferrariae]MBX9244067.1 pyroglutamyl-peptidase I [Actinotalea ferrariae]